MIDVVLQRQRGLLGHQAVDPVVLRLSCDFIVIAGEWLSTQRAQAPFAAILLVPTFDVVFYWLWEEIAFCAFCRLPSVSFDRVAHFMNLDAPCHVCEARRTRRMTNLLPGCIALAKYLLATRVYGAVRRLVPYLKQAAGLDVPPVGIGVAIGLTR